MHIQRISLFYLPVVFGLISLPIPVLGQTLEDFRNPLSPQERRSFQDAHAVAEKVDQIIEARCRKEKVKPAPLTDSFTYFRRLNLDVVGKIPPLIDAHDFSEDNQINKEDIWLQKLLDSPRYSKHMAAVLRRAFLPRAPSQATLPARKQFEMWLQEYLRKDKGYDRLAYDLITNQRSAGKLGNPNAFFAEQGNTPPDQATAVSRVFLGVKLDCARCHSHPFAKWTQKQFWQMAAFFQNGSRDQYGNPILKINIPDTTTVAYATFLDGSETKDFRGYSGKTLLANWLTSRKNPFFAKAAVDKMWEHFFGISILESMESDDKKTIRYPEILDLLAKEFKDHNYDLKFLVRVLVSTRAYHRSSESPSLDPREVQLLARMPVRGLTAEQLYDSLILATGLENKTFLPNKFIQPRTNRLSARDEFVLRFGDESQLIESPTSILQALYLMNGKLINNQVDLKNNHYLRVINNTTKSKLRRLHTLYYLVLSRPPQKQEIESYLPYLESGGPTGDSNQALSDICWALLNCSEFRLNH